MIIENIGGFPSSLGFVGSRSRTRTRLGKTLEVDGGEAASPHLETIASGEYPLSRDLFIYVNTAHAEDNPTLAEFVDWFLSDGIGAVRRPTTSHSTTPRSQETASTWEGR